jgi:hypothetical protein
MRALNQFLQVGRAQVLAQAPAPYPEGHGLFGRLTTDVAHDHRSFSHLKPPQVVGRLLCRNVADSMARDSVTPFVVRCSGLPLVWLTPDL